MTTQDSVFALSGGGVLVVIDVTHGTPQILHWGPDVGHETLGPILKVISTPAVPHAHFPNPTNAGIWKEHSRGFFGRPAIQGHRAGADWSPFFEIVNLDRDTSSCSIVSKDSSAGIEVSVDLDLDETGVLIVSQSITNVGEGVYNLGELTTWLPLPDHATESMDFTGRWLKERQPQRRDIQVGTWAREVREGRTSHDYTIAQLAMTSGAGFQTGEVWSLGLLWSGNSRHLVERLPSGDTHFGAGELLEPGEVSLEFGETYLAPKVAATYSNQGIDGLSARIHSWLRARPNHPTSLKPRPLTLNVWEAVYFDHNLEKLTHLAELAKQVGVERFVLDDGWFGNRRNDKAGLGDWIVSVEVWPQGLKPLSDVIEGLGMEFGLWFEGEMVNPDSDLYRAHPDWILKVGDRMPPESRNQHVLDLTNPDAYQHVRNQVGAVLESCNISYIKWDHNRALTDAAHLGVAAVRKQTQAVYRLFADLKESFPGLEIEACASGGGRIDLGMAMYADRFWTSDCNDATERQHIQRYSQIAIPPEMLGSHIGPTNSHTTHRIHNLSYRAITALFGHAGIEWDLTQATDEELITLSSWAAYYKKNRDLLHSGTVVRVDTDSDDFFVHGVISKDRTRAIFSYVQLATSPAASPAGFKIPGLIPDAQYNVKVVSPAGKPKVVQQHPPLWLDGVSVSGDVLADIGLRPPILAPENALLIEVEKI